MATMHGVAVGVKEKMESYKEQLRAAEETYNRARTEKEMAWRRYLNSCSRRAELKASIEDVNERLEKRETAKQTVAKQLYEKELYLTSMKEYMARMGQFQVEDSTDQNRMEKKRVTNRLNELRESTRRNQERIQQLQGKVEKTERDVQTKEDTVKRLEERRAYLIGEMRYKQGKYDKTSRRVDEMEDRIKDITGDIVRRHREAELFIAQLKQTEKRIGEREKQIDLYSIHNDKLETSVRDLLPCYMTGQRKGGSVT